MQALIMTPTLTVLSSFTALKFSGSKTQEFLQGQLTCDMRELSAHGRSSFAACCDHRGRMLANFWVVNWHHDFLFILPSSLSDTIKNHLQKFAVFSKVMITPAHFFIAELARPMLLDTTPSSIYITLPSKNRVLIIAEQNPYPEISISTDETSFRKNNIDDALAILSDKTSLLFTPQMINLEKLGGVSFTKGCYVGQEIVARTQYLGTLKRHLHQLTLSSETNLTPGAELKNDANEIIGVVIDAIALPDNKYHLLAVLQDHKQ
jgi:folate-binding protein YgfZ